MFDVRGDDVVVVAAPVVPRQQEHGVIPVPGGGDRGDVGPDLVVAQHDVGGGVFVVGGVVPHHRQRRQVRGVGADAVVADDVG